MASPPLIGKQPDSLPPTDARESTSSLVQRVAAGETTAEATLAERFTRGLFAYLRRLGCPPEQAEDIHQETFRIVLERLRGKGLREPEGLAGFLRGTARNLLLDHRRQAAIRKTEADPATLARTIAPVASQLRRVLDREAASLVRQLIGELDVARDREILYRVYIAEDSKAKVCTDLDLSDAHFHRVLFRARQRFKELLEAFEKRQNLLLRDRRDLR